MNGSLHSPTAANHVATPTGFIVTTAVETGDRVAAADDDVELYLLNKEMQCCNGGPLANRTQTLTVSSGYTSDPDENQVS